MAMSFDELKAWLDEQKNASTSKDESSDDSDKSIDEQFNDLKNKLDASDEDKDYKEVDLPEAPSDKSKDETNDDSDESNKEGPVQEYEAAPDDKSAIPPTIPQQGYNLGTDKQLEDAQNEKRWADIGANLGMAGQYIGAGLNRGAKPNLQPFQNQLKQNESIVTDFKDRIANQKNDPNSAVSKTFQEFAEKQLGHKFQGPQSAASMEAAMPYLFKGNEMELNRKLKEKEFGLKHEENMTKFAQVNAYKDMMHQEKVNDAQNKAYSGMRKDMETFRGNRGAQQAAMDIYSSNKALALVKNKDPNTLTTQDLSLLTSEIAKIAQGGVPSEHGMKVLMPNNLQTKYAEMQNFLASKPTDAQAGEYIKKNMKYLQDMQDTAQSTIDDFKRNIAHGYKNRVKSENYDEAMRDENLNQQGPRISNSLPDFVKVRAPSGDVHLIPKNQVEDAVKAGGKVEE